MLFLLLLAAPALINGEAAMEDVGSTTGWDDFGVRDYGMDDFWDWDWLWGDDNSTENGTDWDWDNYDWGDWNDTDNDWFNDTLWDWGDDWGDDWFDLLPEWNETCKLHTNNPGESNLDQCLHQDGCCYRKANDTCLDCDEHLHNCDTCLYTVCSSDWLNADNDFFSCQLDTIWGVVTEEECIAKHCPPDVYGQCSECHFFNEKDPCFGCVLDECGDDYASCAYSAGMDEMKQKKCMDDFCPLEVMDSCGMACIEEDECADKPVTLRDHYNTGQSPVETCQEGYEDGLCWSDDMDMLIGAFHYCPKTCGFCEGEGGDEVVVSGGSEDQMCFHCMIKECGLDYTKCLGEAGTDIMEFLACYYDYCPADLIKKCDCMMDPCAECVLETCDEEYYECEHQANADRDTIEECLDTYCDANALTLCLKECTELDDGKCMDREETLLEYHTAGWTNSLSCAELKDNGLCKPKDSMSHKLDSMVACPDTCGFCDEMDMDTPCEEHKKRPACQKQEKCQWNKKKCKKNKAFRNRMKRRCKKHNKDMVACMEENVCKPKTRKNGTIKKCLYKDL